MSSTGIQAVSASANGYAAHEVRQPSGSALSSLRFVLNELRDIQGRVRDGNGRALSGVEVRVRYLDSDRRLMLDDGMVATTNSSGEFGVAVGQGRFVLDAFADEWVPQSSSVLGSRFGGGTGVGSGSLENVLIELETRGATVSGRVTSASGSAASGVPVLIAVKLAPVGSVGTGAGTVSVPGRLARPYGSRITRRVETDSSGRYEAVGLPPGSLAVVAIQKGTVISVQRFTTSEGDAVNADFVLPD